MSKNENAVSLRDRANYLYLVEKKSQSSICRIINQEYFDNKKSFAAVRSMVRTAIGTKEGNPMNKIENVKKSTKDVVKPENFVLSAWNPDTGKIMDISEYCDFYGLPKEDIKDNKLITHTGTPYWNIHWKSSDSEIINVIDEELFQKVAQRYIKPVKFKKNKKSESDRFIRTIYTDTHIAMCPNPDGQSLFGGVWNERELMKRMKHMAKDTVDRAKKENSSRLIVDDLGDFMDGWKGKTTRGEHSLAQNMSTEDAFDLGIRFKVELADLLVDSGQFSEILFNNVCNDNHAGTFGYVVNSAVKSILDLKYAGIVDVVNHRKFIGHYIIGSHAFVISHGKDDKHMKFGFKPQIDDKQAVRIDQFIKDKGIYRKAEFIEFSKGDSHQMLFDYSSSDDFNYMNYPAFSPSSDWVQTNFKKGISGYVVTSFSGDSKDIYVYPKTFKWNK